MPLNILGHASRRVYEGGQGEAIHHPAYQLSRSPVTMSTDVLKRDREEYEGGQWGRDGCLYISNSNMIPKARNSKRNKYEDLSVSKQSEGETVENMLEEEARSEVTEVENKAVEVKDHKNKVVDVKDDNKDKAVEVSKEKMEEEEEDIRMLEQSEWVALEKQLGIQKRRQEREAAFSKRQKEKREHLARVEHRKAQLKRHVVRSGEYTELSLGWWSLEFDWFCKEEDYDNMDELYEGLEELAISKSLLASCLSLLLHLSHHFPLFLVPPFPRFKTSLLIPHPPSLAPSSSLFTLHSSLFTLKRIPRSSLCNPTLLHQASLSELIPLSGLYGP